MTTDGKSTFDSGSSATCGRSGCDRVKEASTSQDKRGDGLRIQPHVAADEVSTQSRKINHEQNRVANHRRLQGLRGMLPGYGIPSFHAFRKTWSSCRGGMEEAATPVEKGT